MQITGKAHCLFEQSGTFKKEFIKLGIPAEDYDIQNNFGETDHVVDIFADIEKAYDTLTRQDKTRHYLTKSTRVKTLCLHFSHVSILKLCHVCIFHAIRLIISTSRRMRESRTLSTDWRSAHIFTNCFINFVTLQRVKT